MKYKKIIIYQFISFLLFLLSPTSKQKQDFRYIKWDIYGKFILENNNNLERINR